MRAKSKDGTGFGNGLANQVMSTAYDIVKAGVTDPEFFELLPFFQENVGADRLSDMIATLILEDIREEPHDRKSDEGVERGSASIALPSPKWAFVGQEKINLFISYAFLLHSLPKYPDNLTPKSHIS